MLKILDLDKNPLNPITNYKDYSIESTLSSGDKVLSFACPIELCRHIREEMYIENESDSFVIKQTSDDNGWTKFVALLNIEELEGKPIEKFETKEKTAAESLRLAFVDTGWTVTCSSDKKRTIRETNTTPWRILQRILKTYLLEPIIDTKNKNVTLLEKVGSNKGVYFMDSLNLRKLRTQGDSTEFCTRLIPIGKDGLRITAINGGKEYLENYQHSSKIKTLYWKDERYTVPEHLKEDAIAKLRDMSKPKRSYEVEVIDLAKAKKGDKVEDYSILSYSIGDIITLISKDNKIREYQRIVKTTTFPDEPERNTLELSNTILSFEELQKQLEEAAETVDNITSDNGTVSGSTIDGISLDQVYDFSVKAAKILKLDVIEADIKDLTANNVTITGRLDVAVADIGTIKTTYLKATDAEIKYAKIENLNATNANIGTLNADYANFKTVTVEQLNVAKGWMVEGSIGSAQISELSANKIRSGTIDTALVTVAAKDSLISISGNQIMVNDTTDPLSPVNRVILGKYKKADSTEEYGLLVRSADGSTVMLDGNGVHNAGITDGAIDNNKVADDANIAGKKLDINSVIVSINGATETISSTVIQVGSKFLNVLLQEQNDTLTQHGNLLTTQGTKIDANEKGIKAAVTQTSFDNYTKEMGEWKTLINANVQGLTTRVSATESEQTAQGLRITSAESAIEQHASDISLSVKKNGVISAINLSQEGITINANKINMSGVVTIEDLKNNGSTTIAGGTLTCTSGNFSNLTIKDYFVMESTASNKFLRIDYGLFNDIDPELPSVSLPGSLGVSASLHASSVYTNSISVKKAGQDIHIYNSIKAHGNINVDASEAEKQLQFYGKHNVVLFMREPGNTRNDTYGLWDNTEGKGIVYDATNKLLNCSFNMGHIILEHKYGLFGRAEGGSNNWIAGVEKRDNVNAIRFGNNTLRTYIFTASDVYSNGGWKKTSDLRLKTDVTGLDQRYLAMFDNLNPVLYSWVKKREEKRQEVGYIAQEVAAAMTAAGISQNENNIISTTMFTENPDDPAEKEKKTLSISYEELAVVAAYALKDARARIKELENKIVEMEELR